MLEELPADDPRRLILQSFRAAFSAQQQRDHRGRGRELQEQRCLAEDRGDQALAAELLTRQLESERRERRWRQQAIELYLQVAAGPAAGAVALQEQALIQLAVLLVVERRGIEARAAAERLIKEHPHSRFVPYALLVLAESLFERGTAAR